jgi:hypothetical protein
MHTFWRCEFHTCTPIRTLTVFCISPEETTTALSCLVADWTAFVADICSGCRYHHLYIRFGKPVRRGRFAVASGLILVLAALVRPRPPYKFLEPMFFRSEIDARDTFPNYLDSNKYRLSHSLRRIFLFYTFVHVRKLSRIARKLQKVVLFPVATSRVAPSLGSSISHCYPSVFMIPPSPCK